MRIGLVRRGFSATGGAEAYLRRFAEAAVIAGHECVLFTDAVWPGWPHRIVQIAGSSPRAFADRLEASRPREHCDFLLSLERVWSCDAYRAGDGVHAAWLERRARFEPAWKGFARAFNPKHRALLKLEESLFRERRAGWVIANSQLVKAEIAERYGYPADRITVIYNGLPPAAAPTGARAEMRRELGLGADDYVALFAGSGWERKGLRFAIEAIRSTATTLLVAGRGTPPPAPGNVRFLGPRADLPRLLAAADVFVLPTIYDPFSNACLEALAAGLPVITTRANGFPEIIRTPEEGDALDDPADIAAITAALARWSSREAREAIRPRLAQLGATFSIERNVRETLAVIGAQKPNENETRGREEV